jgi:DNA-binding FrmR family transcriptional regulator
MANTTPGYITEKQAYLNRLKRIEGQVRGLQRMVDEDTYCIDILTQVSAATKALEKRRPVAARGASASLRHGRGARRRHRGRLEDLGGLAGHRQAGPL